MKKIILTLAAVAMLTMAAGTALAAQQYDCHADNASLSAPTTINELDVQGITVEDFRSKLLELPNGSAIYACKGNGEEVQGRMMFRNGEYELREWRVRIAEVNTKGTDGI